MNKRLSTFQLALISSGGMLGCGWLFSPFYGYQTAGIGVLYSWPLTAIIIAIIGLSFAEVCSMLPTAGGIYRFMNITHNKNIASVFLILGWLSYVVYLPLEAQAIVQYLGFWMPSLISKVANQVELSKYGVTLAVIIIFGITWFNTLVITKIANTNSVISFWKISIPIIISIIVIIFFGSWHKFTGAYNFANFNSENVLLAVTSSGLAFAFSGFQNGLLLANQVKNPAKAIPHSLLWPLIIGLVLYGLVSLSYLVTLDGKEQNILNATAPLLGLLSLLGLNFLFTILFIDAIIAPLGTTNIYTAVTSRILYVVGKEVFPKSKLTKLNKNQVPIVALWINAVIGIIFLFPLPTWKELVNFLSSLVILAYLAGPISLMVLRKKQPDLQRKFKVKCPYLIGIMGFVCCSWLIYWSGKTNLGYLWIVLLVMLVIYSSKSTNLRMFLCTIRDYGYMLIYLGSLWMISFLRAKNIIPFPIDNILVAAISPVFCYLLFKNSLTVAELEQNVAVLQNEILDGAKS